jgi:hypothetical protein
VLGARSGRRPARTPMAASDRRSGPASPSATAECTGIRNLGQRKLPQAVLCVLHQTWLPLSTPCRDMVVAVAGHGAHVPICPRQDMLRATPVNAPAHFLRDLDIFLSLCISSWRVPVVLVPTKLSSDPSLRRGGRREINCRSALLYV